MNKSQTERDIELAVDHFRMALQSALCKTELDLYIQVRGVELETFYGLKENESLSVNMIENQGMNGDKTNYYMNLDFQQTCVCLNSLNEI